MPREEGGGGSTASARSRGAPPAPRTRCRPRREAEACCLRWPLDKFDIYIYIYLYLKQIKIYNVLNFLQFYILATNSSGGHALPVIVARTCFCTISVIAFFFVKLSLCLVWFQIYEETKMFHILRRNDSRSNQNHFVKLFDPFVEIFCI
jgi:hypothetical protein